MAGTDTLSDVTGVYGQAKDVLSKAGLTPIVATRVGDQVADDQCVIDRIQNARFLGGTGSPSKNTVYVYLNCYANVASPRRAGCSPAVSAGPRAYEAQQHAAAQAAAPQGSECRGERGAENQR